MTTTDLARRYTEMLTEWDEVYKSLDIAQQSFKYLSKALRGRHRYPNWVDVTPEGALTFTPYPPEPGQRDEGRMLNPRDFIHVPENMLLEVSEQINRLNVLRKERPELEEKLKAAGLAALIRA